MTRVALASLVFLSLALPAGATELRRIPLDDAAAVGLTIDADRTEKVEGVASIRITTDWPTTICLAEVDDLDVDNARLVYSARLKSDLEGTAFLELWAHVGAGQYFSRGRDSRVSGQADWTTVSTPFFFQKGQRPDKLTLNLVVDGRGTVWVDDIVLSRESLEN